MREFLKKVLPVSIRRFIREFPVKLLRIMRLDLYYFYNDMFASSAQLHKMWVDKFYGIIEKEFHPNSIIDIGCGTGDILKPFEAKGKKILGVDGSKANKRHSEISVKNFLLFDLRNGYVPKEKYDLCLCLEVAEHMEEKDSDILIRSLTRASSTIIFSAAPPGQEGHGHANLKPYKWWIDKFNRFNFVLDKHSTDNLKKGMEQIGGVEKYYIDNLLIFKEGLFFSDYYPSKI